MCSCDYQEQGKFQNRTLLYQGPQSKFQSERWYFTFKGAECSAPLPIDGVVYLGGAKSQDPHRVRHIEGHCNNIHKGRVRVGFWVGNCPSYGNADAFTGWNSVSRIFVEEIPKPQA